MITDGFSLFCSSDICGSELWQDKHFLTCKGMLYICANENIISAGHYFG